MCHVGLLGGHRLTAQTLELLKRSVYWDKMEDDVTYWTDRCLTCIRFRKKPRKNASVPSVHADAECWEEVMVDMEGPRHPADHDGNTYVMTYSVASAMVSSWNQSAH